MGERFCTEQLWVKDVLRMYKVIFVNAILLPNSGRILMSVYVSRDSYFIILSNFYLFGMNLLPKCVLILSVHLDKDICQEKAGKTPKI